MQTRSIGQANVDVWVSPHGLHCHSLYTGTCRLLGCNCLLEVWQWDGANLHQFPYSNCMTFFQPWCKPVVLDKQCWYLGCSTWVVLAQFRTTCILAGCLVVTACLKIKLWDGAHLHSFPYSNCMNFLPTFVQTSGTEQIRVDVWVTPHGLHCHSLNSGRLFRCICLLEV